MTAIKRIFAVMDRSCKIPRPLAAGLFISKRKLMKVISPPLCLPCIAGVPAKAGVE